MMRWVLAMLDRARDVARRRRWAAHLAQGRRGEDLAHRFLQRAGMRVVARGYRTATGSGEVDLIAWDGTTLVFVEVKTRGTDEVAAPERSVDPGKQARIRRAAWAYLRALPGAAPPLRADIVSVVLGAPPRLRLLRDAFPLQAPVE
jgi:putative endonuclease